MNLSVVENVVADLDYRRLLHTNLQEKARRRSENHIDFTDLLREGDFTIASQDKLEIANASGKGKKEDPDAKTLWGSAENLQSIRKKTAKTPLADGVVPVLVDALSHIVTRTNAGANPHRNSPRQLHRHNRQQPSRNRQNRNNRQHRRERHTAG